MPFRGSVRQEDVMAQSTQRPLGAREERLGASDRGVIVLRRLVRDAIEAVQRGERPRGAPSPDQAERLVAFDSFVGLRPIAGEQ